MFLAVTACIILGQIVESIVGEGGSRAIDIAARHVAPGVIEARVGLPGLGAAGRAQAVEAGQLVGMTAVTVEVLWGCSDNKTEDVRLWRLQQHRQDLQLRTYAA